MKQSILILSAAIILSALVGCASTKNESLKNNSINYLTRVPFEYNNRLIELTVGMEVRKGNPAFILDSGAPTFITDSLTEAYDLEYIHSEIVSDINGNEQKVNLYYIKSVDICGMKFENIVAASNSNVSEMPILKGHHYAGLLGANLMKKSIWKINYKCREIILTDKSEKLSVPDDIHYVEMKLDELGRPVIKVNIGEKQDVKFIVDVGFNGSLLLPDNYLSKPIFQDSLAFIKRVKFSAGFETGVKQINYKFLKNISIGHLNLENIKVLVSDNNAMALIGNEFLERYIIIMDFVNERLAFLPAEKFCSTKCC